MQPNDFDNKNIDDDDESAKVAVRVGKVVTLSLRHLSPWASKCVMIY